MTKINSIFKALALSLAALACAALPAQDMRPTLAVMEPSGNTSVTQMNKMTALGALQQYLVNSRRYRVVDRSRIDQIMSEHGFARGGLVDTNRIKEIGKMLQADIVAVSELLKDEGAFIAQCSLIDVETGEVTASAYELIEADTPVEIRNAMNRAAMTLLGMEPPPASPAAMGAAAANANVPDSLQDPRQARIAVVIPEIHISARIPDPAGETAIIRKLLEAGFTRVVDQSQVQRIRESDQVRAMIRGDMDAVIGIGQQLGVDYLIVGEAFSEAVGRVAGNMFSCRARVEARIIRTDNARIIAAHGMHAGGVDLVEFNAAKTALNNAGELMGDYFVQQLERMGGSVDSGVKLTITGVTSFARASEIERALRGVRGVETVRMNEYALGVVTIDLTVNVSVQQLAASIGELRQPRLEVTEISGSALKISVR